MIGAVVVGYYPDYPVLDALLLGLLDQADLVIYVNNGGGENYLSHHPTQKARVQLVDSGRNNGVGSALNQGLELALKQGCSYVATFDQDSILPDGLIKGLLEAHLELQGNGIVCAAVGPVFYDRRAEQIIYYPFYKEQNSSIHTIRSETISDRLIEVDVLITSGMLVNVKSWAAGFHYDPALFVDHTDTEWCHRVRAEGFRLYACLDLKMGHALSDTVPVRVLGRHFFRYSPLRRYYYFRNTVYLLLRPYISWAWKRQLAYGLGLRFFVNVMIDRSKLSSLKMMCKGVVDAFSGRLGEINNKPRH